MAIDLAERPPLIPAPDDPAAWSDWRKQLHEWRAETRRSLGYDGAAYAKPEFAWMQSCFAFAKVMLFDREFYDPESGRFRVDAWLDRMEREFGGIDALALWQAYPRIGIDRRNQFDHYRLAPGGVPALKQLVDSIHRRGVKVVLAYNPWDTGTRRESKGDPEVLAGLVDEIGFDGIFLDTLDRAGSTLRPGVVLESELALPVEAIADHHASWAQWMNDSQAPGVLRNKWFERRHMMHVVRRWDTDHSGELHQAWMNGVGIFIWQNVFGSWNGWNERDKSILRSMLPIQRRFRHHLTEGDWKPLVEVSGAGLFASQWILDGVTLWTMVNRDSKPVDGFVQGISSDGSMRVFDLVRGIELDHAQAKVDGRWIGALALVPSSRVDDSFKQFLHDQAARFAKVNPYVLTMEPMPIHVPIRATAPSSLPTGMRAIAPGTHRLVSKFRVRECGEYGYAALANQTYPPLHQERIVERIVEIGQVGVMESEVTNAQYRQFVRETNYRPASAEQFLAHWVDGAPKAGDEHSPVTYVSLDDVRAYAAWKGWRLPTEDEWQLAVQSLNLPHGQVWNWTESEHRDGRTTFSIVKGGSKVSTPGSQWYFDSGVRQADWSAKLIHFWPGMDRSEAIGFRCAVDLTK